MWILFFIYSRANNADHSPILRHGDKDITHQVRTPSLDVVGIPSGKFHVSTTQSGNFSRLFHREWENGKISCQDDCLSINQWSRWNFPPILRCKRDVRLGFENTCDHPILSGIFRIEKYPFWVIKCHMISGCWLSRTASLSAWNPRVAMSINMNRSRGKYAAGMRAMWLLLSWFWSLTDGVHWEIWKGNGDLHRTGLN